MVLYSPRKLQIKKGYPDTGHDFILSILVSTVSVAGNNIQGVSRLVDISAGGDFLGFCDQKSSYKHVSDFGRLRSYDRLKLRIEGNNY